QIVKNLENEEGLVVILGDAQHWSQNSREHFFANLHAAICKALDDDSGPVNRYDDFHAFIQRRAKHYRFVLIIDEFEEMAVNPEFDADFFTCLRALGNDDRCNFGYLLASRLSLEKICNDTDKVSSLFWNIFYTYTLGLLSRQEAVTLIHKPFHRSLGLRLADEEVKKIYRYTGCHPAFIQMFMDKIWISKDGGYNPDWEQLEFNLRSHYGALWEQRSPAETALLILLAAGKTPNRDFAFSELRQRGLIDKNGQNFSVFFKLLIPAWLPPGKDLQSVLGEIEQGVDKGSRFFDTFLKMAEMAGKVRKAFVSGGEDEHG
ncbi:MAG: hypothetical protein GY862_28260, partial [Gammaproteobacteria bacterium]|nr:hypothetical protein [Gammaproteobacteria bacterium]